MRRVDVAEGRAAVAAWASGQRDRETVASAVRYLLEELAARHPGHSVEVRVPPYGAVQCGEGPRHTRGTPPNVVEMTPDIWLGLATAELSWDAAVASARVAASGARASLADMMPLT